jgi:hypothetical protein
MWPPVPINHAKVLLAGDQARGSSTVLIRGQAAMPYPVSVTITPQPGSRNRLTTAFRLLLAIPHAILVGPVWFARAGSAGLLGVAAYFLAIVTWFAILITGNEVQGIREFSLYYLRWRARAAAYMALFTDQYPPFGDGPYPVSLDVAAPTVPRDRASVALRLLLAIPHFFVLFFLLIGWCVTSVIAWFAILFTGAYPPSLFPFGAGVMRWMVRVEAYLLLLIDEYPPFAIE